MVKQLDHTEHTVAEEIYTVFQRSYQIEAELIGVQDFPPLARCAQQINKATTIFYGYFCQQQLAGVIEVSYADRRLDIDSLTVDPAHFKKGIASALISAVLQQFDFTEAVVETAVANAPAIRLYQKHGFVEFKQWLPAHGIAKIALVRKQKLTN